MYEEFIEYVKKNYMNNRVVVQKRNGKHFKATVEGIDEEWVYFRNDVVTSFVRIEDISGMKLLPPNPVEEEEVKQGG